MLQRLLLGITASEKDSADKRRCASSGVSGAISNRHGRTGRRMRSIGVVNHSSLYRSVSVVSRAVGRSAAPRGFAEAGPANAVLPPGRATTDQRSIDSTTAAVVAFRPAHPLRLLVRPTDRHRLHSSIITADHLLTAAFDRIASKCMIDNHKTTLSAVDYTTL